MASFRGIAFPFGKSKVSFPEKVEDDELVKQSIVQIVTTVKGERVMRPEFGSSAFAFIFENNNEILAELIKDEISRCITRFEPRAILRNVAVQRQNSEVIVTIVYVVALTGTQDKVSVTVPSNS